jgi:hypothetical protein
MRLGGGPDFFQVIENQCVWCGEATLCRGHTFLATTFGNARKGKRVLAKYAGDFGRQ